MRSLLCASLLAMTCAAQTADIWVMSLEDQAEAKHLWAAKQDADDEWGKFKMKMGSKFVKLAYPDALPHPVGLKPNYLPIEFNADFSAAHEVQLSVTGGSGATTFNPVMPGAYGVGTSCTVNQSGVVICDNRVSHGN